MKTQSVTVDLPGVSPEQMFDAVHDVANWPAWDAGLEKIEIGPGPSVEGTEFYLTPKGGPRTRIRIEKLVPGRLHRDLSFLPLGKMQMEHTFEPIAGGTRATVTVSTWGPLGWLWWRIIGKNQIAEAAEHERDLARYAVRSFAPAQSA